MKSANVTNAVLAEELGVSVQAVGGWLKTGKISACRLPGIAHRLGQTVDYMMGIAKPQPSAKADMIAKRIAMLPLELQDQLGSVIDTMSAMVPAEYVQSYNEYYIQRLKDGGKRRQIVKNDGNLISSKKKEKSRK